MCIQHTAHVIALFTDLVKRILNLLQLLHKFRMAGGIRRKHADQPQYAGTDCICSTGSAQYTHDRSGGRIAEAAHDLFDGIDIIVSQISAYGVH